MVFESWSRLAVGEPLRERRTLIADTMAAVESIL
jgi:hypothetical protein